MCREVKRLPLDTLELTSDYEPKKATEVFKARQKSKALTKAINGKLLYLDSEIHKDYQQAWYCNQYLIQEGAKVTSSYCRKRSCLVCSRIFAARLMQGYVKPILALPDLHMVTLTAPNVKSENLQFELDKFYASFVKIKDNLRKNYGVKLQGFRKLEITFNHRTKEYNPHYHILVSTREAADQVRRLWLTQFKEASYKAQDVTKINSTNALLEVFKYVTKAIVKDTFDAKALDKMYIAMKNRRAYQPMGIKKSKAIKIEQYESNFITHRSERIEVWKWCNSRYDWYAPDGEKFNDGDLQKETKRIIKVIDTSNTSNERKEQYRIKTDAEIFLLILLMLK